MVEPVDTLANPYGIFVTASEVFTKELIILVPVPPSITSPSQPLSSVIYILCCPLNNESIKVSFKIST